MDPGLKDVILSTLSPYSCVHVDEIFNEVRMRGYSGSRSSYYSAVRQLISDGDIWSMDTAGREDPMLIAPLEDPGYEVCDSF